MTARRWCIIGIRRGGTSERSRGRPGSSTIQLGRGGISRTATRGISGAIMIVVTSSNGSATVIAASTSITASAKAGYMHRAASLARTPISSAETTAPVPTGDVKLATGGASGILPGRPFLMLGSQTPRTCLRRAGGGGPLVCSSAGVTPPGGCA